jgi:hypothetical protein
MVNPSVGIIKVLYYLSLSLHSMGFRAYDQGHVKTSMQTGNESATMIQEVINRAQVIRAVGANPCQLKRW